MRWTKGQHAFIVATHVDKAHIHNHIIYNSTTLSCDRKFRKFWFCGVALQRLSDLVCLENGLSVIEPVKPSQRVKRTEYPDRRSFREDIRDAMRITMKALLKMTLEYADKVFILDTKYKMISRFEGNPDEARQIIGNESHQGDVYQVCEYARKRGASDVYLLYPQFRFEDVDTSFPIAKSGGAGGDIFIHFVRLPFIFEEDETQVKNNLTTVIKSILGVDNL